MKWSSWKDVEISINNNDGISWDRWKDRVEKLAYMLGDDIESVMDLGAGNMGLKNYINPKITYYPVDYCKRCEDTIVCDFNKKEFPNIKVDAIFISGCLEYVEDYEWFIKKVCKVNAKEIVISYGFLLSETQYEIEKKMSGRWVNAIKYREFIKCFASNGYMMTLKERMHNDDPQLLMKFERIDYSSIERLATCTGCSACQNICPANAITMAATLESGYRPTINKELCIKCGQCIKVCPSLNAHYDNETKPMLYAAWAQDDIRRDSSSGGAFSVLATDLIKNEAKVYGVGWSKTGKLTHMRIDRVEDIKNVRHSKYVQSCTVDIYKQVKEDLVCGSEVLFVGTPCQVAGLKNYIGEEEKLYTVDLICKYAPSPALFEKYADENSISSIVCRDKSDGWRPDLQRVILKDKREIMVDMKDDKFQQGFHPCLFMEEVCENCQFACFPRQGDITLGDFWGIEEIDNTWNDRKGTSMIFINSKKGEALLESCRSRFQRIEYLPVESLEYFSIRRINRIDGFWPASDKRERFCELIKTHSFNDSVHMALEDKYDVGLVGPWMNANYGGAITYYALYEAIKEQGFSVLMISQPLKSRRRPSYLDVGFNTIPYAFSDIAKVPKNIQQYEGFNDVCNTFCVGSDQLFHSDFFTGIQKVNGLGWVKGYKNKVGYAISWGREYYDGDEQERLEMELCLSRFQSVSVREKSGVTLAKEQFNLDTTLVLDPVFLCNVSKYERMIEKAKRPRGEEEFLFTYILDATEEKAKAISKFSENTGINKICAISDAGVEVEWNLKTILDANNEEWLAHFKKAKFIITDSYHGVCFSIIFNKPFIAIINDKRGKTRFESILELFNLKDRAVVDVNEINQKQFTPIDYEKVNCILAEERNRCIKWLKNALEQEGTKDMDAWDFFSAREKEIRQQVHISETNRRIVEQEYKKAQMKDWLGLSENIKHTMEEMGNWDAVRATNSFEFVSKWVYLKQKNISITEKFRNKKVAIYGLGLTGVLLINELKCADINICYLMDRRVNEFDKMSVYHSVPKNIEVDMIIVTPVNGVDEIEQDLLLYTKAEIISLDDIISDLYKAYCW